MMTWNYRIIHHNEDESYYGLHEVYYDENGAIDGWTEDALIVGDTKDEILETLAMMKSDIEKHDVILLSKGGL